MSNRKLAVNGQFYPDNKDEVLRYIDHFNNILDENNFIKSETIKPKAIIVPHAGYVYSGFTANIAYKYIPENIKNIIVIGPSHKFRFDGASVGIYDRYPTPLGDLTINKNLSKSLIDKFDFLHFLDDVHNEHSTEVQFPFIKKYSDKKNVVEIVYSAIDHKKLSILIEELLKDSDNFIVISTDLSHFYDLKTANKLDNICLKGFVEKNIEVLEQGCEACGMLGVKAILEVSQRLNYETQLLDYRTSADASGDKTKVVGYVSAIVGEKGE